MGTEGEEEGMGNTCGVLLGFLLGVVLLFVPFSHLLLLERFFFF